MEGVFTMCDDLFNTCAELRCFLLIRKSLFQMGVNIDGANVVFVIVWAFHQAVRVAAVVNSLKQGCCLMDWLRIGRCLFYI